MVVFPALRTAHTGDMFASKGLPLVDGNNGGSVLHYPETLNKVHAGIKNVDTLINGHSDTTTTWADLKKFAEFNQDFLTWAQGALKIRQDARSGGRRVESACKVRRLLVNGLRAVRRRRRQAATAQGGNEVIADSANPRRADRDDDPSSRGPLQRDLLTARGQHAFPVGQLDDRVVRRPLAIFQLT